MEDYTIKDRILECLHEERGCDISTRSVISRISDLGTGIDAHRIRNYLDEIISNGYAKEKLSDTIPNIIEITSKGVVFIRDRGSYTQQDFDAKLQESMREGEKKREKSRSKWDRRREWGLAVLALCLAVLNVVQYLKCH